jgi:hypothetical protein
MQFLHFLICAHKIHNCIMRRVQRSVSFVKVHYCVIIRSQVIIKFICQDKFLFYFIPKFACSLFYLFKLGSWIYSKSTYITVVWYSILLIILLVLKKGIIYKSFHANSLDNITNARNSRKDLSISFDTIKIFIDYEITHQEVIQFLDQEVHRNSP